MKRTSDLVYVLFRLFLVFGILFFLIYFLIVVVVPENYVFLEERLGKYHRTLLAGLHFQIPIIDSIRYKFSQKEQSIFLRNLKCETADGVEVWIDSIYIYQIQDPVKAAYQAEDYAQSILEEIKSNLMAEIHNHYAEELFARRYGMNQSIVKHLAEHAKSLGLKTIRFEIQQMQRETKIT